MFCRLERRIVFLCTDAKKHPIVLSNRSIESECQWTPNHVRPYYHGGADCHQFDGRHISPQWLWERQVAAAGVADLNHQQVCNLHALHIRRPRNLMTLSSECETRRWTVRSTRSDVQVDCTSLLPDNQVTTEFLVRSLDLAWSRYFLCCRYTLTTARYTELISEENILKKIRRI